MTDLSRHKPVSGATQRPAHSPTTAWGLTGLLVVLYTINYGDKVVLGIVARPLQEELGFTASQIGLAGSAFFLAMAIGGFLAGTINRFASLRWALAGLAIAWGLCMLPIVVWATFTVLIVSRFLLGLFEGPSSALIHTATYSWHPTEKRSLPGAFITSAAAISKIVLAPALGYVVVTHGWRWAFIALAGASVIWLGLWLAFWRPGPYGDEPTNGGSTKPTSLVQWKELMRTPTFLGGMVAVFSFYTLTSVVLTWLPTYFELVLGYSRIQANSLFGVPSIVALIALFTVSFLADRLISRGVRARVFRAIVPGSALLICAASMIAAPIIQTPALVVAIVSIGYGLGTIVYPLLNAAISEICPRDRLAGTLGFFLAVMTCGGLIGPFLSGVVVDHAATPAEGYSTVFQLLGLLTAVGGLCALLFVHPTRDAARITAIQRRREADASTIA
ncbi:MFS transporter [Saccharopolyspora sp. NPDC050389]|uniref:MFS transporter n=1 Tax=Saccharopolyspora sp. NPDC050389 TaxID=3155516 RepID=UPI00340E675B